MTSPAPNEEARERLDRLMDQRRAELRMRWKDVAAKAALTTEGLLGVRKGTGEIRALTKRGIEDALQWEGGSVDAILGGGEPAVTEYRRRKESPMDEAEAIMDENEQLARELVERVRRLDRRKRRVVEQMIEVLEEDQSGPSQR